MFTENEIILMSGNTMHRITQKHQIPTGLKLEVFGSHNKIILGEQCLFQNTVISIVNDNTSVQIGNGCRMENLFIDINSGNGQHLEIGDKSVFFGGKIVLRDKDFVKIGQDCLFADGLRLWATDAHTLFDLETNQVINETPEKLEIGNHCWIGGDVHIMKNGSLPDETVVGMCSVITKPFTEPHTVIGGYPAKVLRRGIGWSRDTIPDWLKKDESLK